MTDKPSKLYYSISEVAKISGVKAHVLRYWESEFPTLRPGKTRTGSRRYRQRDIDEILAIKKLLYEEGFRISGARKVRRQMLSAHRRGEPAPAPQLEIPFGDLDPIAQLRHVRQELRQIQLLLTEMGADSPGLPRPGRPTAKRARKAKG